MKSMVEKNLTKDVRDALRLAVTGFQSTSRIPVAFGGLVVGEDQLVIGEQVGFRTDALINLRIDGGAGLGGRVMTTRRPLGVSDYTRAHVITHDYDREVIAEGLRSIAAVPVIVGRRSRAVLFAGVHAAVRLGDRVLDELTQTGRCLEQSIAVLDSIDQQGSSVSRASTGAEWEQIRMVHSQLRLLASRTEDSSIRSELESMCEQMITGPQSGAVPRLSVRELDVLACVALGHTNIETAKEMGIGAETVKSYLRSGMRKLGAHTRYEAVNAARRIGALP